MPFEKSKLKPSIVRILQRKARSGEIRVLHNDVIASHVHFAREYRDMKTSSEIETFLRKSGLPSIDKLVNSFNKPLNTLDVGAGSGEFGEYLKRRFNEKIKYFGIDVKESERVNKYDIVKENLPKEAFELIFSFFTFPYLTDKFRAIENIINALSVNGYAVIPDFGYFEINGNKTSNYSSSGRAILMSLFRNNNLDVIVRPEGGILIRKKASFNFKLPVKFKKALPLKPFAYLKSIEQQKVSLEANSLISCYTY